MILGLIGQSTVINSTVTHQDDDKSEDTFRFGNPLFIFLSLMLRFVVTATCTYILVLFVFIRNMQYKVDLSVYLSGLYSYRHQRSRLVMVTFRYGWAVLQKKKVQNIILSVFQGYSE